MPELPEVECVRRSVEPLLIGKRVQRVNIACPDICDCFSGSLDNLKSVNATPGRLLQGCDISQLIRHGKQLAILTRQGPSLCVHLGMSGQLADAATIADRTKANAIHGKHIHVKWHLSDGNAVSFRDPRRFGGVWSYESEAALRQHRFSSLGPDGLKITGSHLQQAASKSQRAVKAALLDQAVIAGVGNIYADEALFIANISPLRKCTKLTSAQWNIIAKAICQVLTQSIAAGGSTLRDYVNAKGERGRNQESHAVYGRADEPCLICNSPLRCATVAQRTTVWCGKCQH